MVGACSLDRHAPRRRPPQASKRGHSNPFCCGTLRNARRFCQRPQLFPPLAKCESRSATWWLVRAARLTGDEAIDDTRLPVTRHTRHLTRFGVRAVSSWRRRAHVRGLPVVDGFRNAAVLHDGFNPPARRIFAVVAVPHRRRRGDAGHRPVQNGRLGPSCDDAAGQRRRR